MINGFWVLVTLFILSMVHSEGLFCIYNENFWITAGSLLNTTLYLMAKGGTLALPPSLCVTKLRIKSWKKKLVRKTLHNFLKKLPSVTTALRMKSREGLECFTWRGKGNWPREWQRNPWSCVCRRSQTKPEGELPDHLQDLFAESSTCLRVPQLEQLKALLTKNVDVFSTRDLYVGCTDLAKHWIDTATTDQGGNPQEGLHQYVAKKWKKWWRIYGSKV